MIQNFILLMILFSSFISYGQDHGKQADETNDVQIEEPSKADPGNIELEESIIDDSPYENDESGLEDLPSYEEPHTPYIMSRFMGTFIGFGFGHAFQGRWFSTGWIYTIIDVVSLPVVSKPWPLYGRDENYRYGLGTYILTRIFEIYDVWAYEEEAKTAVSVQPLSFQQENRRVLGFHISMKF